MPQIFRSLLALTALIVAVPAAAAPAWVRYTPASLERAEAAGKTIVVDVFADWCPTCRAQKPTLEALRADPRMANVLFVRVNFDTDRGFLRSNHVRYQSTVLVFKGRKETARTVAETHPDALRAAILAGI